MSWYYFQIRFWTPLTKIRTRNVSVFGINQIGKNQKRRGRNLPTLRGGFPFLLGPLEWRFTVYILEISKKFKILVIYGNDDSIFSWITYLILISKNYEFPQPNPQFVDDQPFHSYTDWLIHSFICVWLICSFIDDWPIHSLLGQSIHSFFNWFTALFLHWWSTKSFTYWLLTDWYIHWWLTDLFIHWWSTYSFIDDQLNHSLMIELISDQQTYGWTDSLL